MAFRGVADCGGLLIDSVDDVEVCQKPDGWTYRVWGTRHVSFAFDQRFETEAEAREFAIANIRPADR